MSGASRGRTWSAGLMGLHTGMDAYLKKDKIRLPVSQLNKGNRIELNFQT